MTVFSKHKCAHSSWIEIELKMNRWLYFQKSYETISKKLENLSDSSKWFYKKYSCKELDLTELIENGLFWDEKIWKVTLERLKPTNPIDFRNAMHIASINGRNAKVWKFGWLENGNIIAITWQIYRMPNPHASGRSVVTHNKNVNKTTCSAVNAIKTRIEYTYLAINK